MICGKKGLFLLVVILLVTPVLATDRLIINSKDWKDVYSGTIYGNFIGKSPDFLTSTPHATLILNGYRTDDDLTVFSSRRFPWISGYGSTIKSRGFDSVEEEVFDSLSLELARELDDIKNFIILDDSYGYNAIAVAPYAMLSRSYVLFADKTNIVEIEDFLDERQPESILIYGHIDREVFNALERFNPETINEDGDRFANNVEIVKKYMEIKETGQVLLTNGEFIEESFMSDQYPILFIGRNNVPDKIKEYVKSSTINTGVLIGNDLVGTATVIRRELGISVFVKFARSARDPDGPIAQVEDLDIFAVPRVFLDLNISGVRYNKFTRQLEVTYRNDAEVVTYFKGSYTLVDGDNEQSFGDLDAIFIGPQSFKTVVYDVEPLVGDSAFLDVFTIFGESKNSLEFILDGRWAVSTVDIKDDTDIELRNAYYDTSKERFEVVIGNIGKKEVFVDTEIIDIILQGETLTLHSEGILDIKPGKSKKARLLAVLDERDIEANPTIRVRSFYGARESALVKIIEGEFELVLRGPTLITYLPTVLLIILIILVLLSITKKKCDSCGHKNNKFRKTCKKCGHKLK
ncbi:zinc ribbon domain-containing protein [Candidatus Woesearchaeota archaeon]|nr:zinc ribbon domain-containing protein [Candidatus Woesearchaeota archaeon]